MNLEGQKFPQEKTHYPEELKNESRILSKFRGKAGRIARIMLLTTTLLSGYEGIIHHKEVGEGIDKIVNSLDKLAERYHGKGVIISKNDVANHGPTRFFSPANEDEYSKLQLRTGHLWGGQEDEKFKVTVSFDGNESTFTIEKKDFDELKVGDSVPVTMEIFQMAKRILKISV
jgi:hypothetical protein